MIGLTCLRELYNLTMQELADKIEVSKQLVSMWESEKKAISKDKLKKLSKLFNQPEEYLTKELSDVEKLEAEYRKLETQLNYDINEGGNKNYIISGDNDINNSIELDTISLEIETYKLFEDMQKSIFSNSIGYGERNIDLFSKLLTIIKNEDEKQINMNIVYNILNCLLVYYNIQNENDLYNIESYNDMPEYMKELWGLSKEFKESVFNVIKQAEERIKEAHKMKK